MTVARNKAVNPSILNPGAAACVIHTMAISITRLNKFKVKRRRGKVMIFNSGSRNDIKAAKTKPAKKRELALPSTSTPPIYRADKAMPKAQPRILTINLFNMGSILLKYGAQLFISAKLRFILP
jgi:hypothetical protein